MQPIVESLRRQREQILTDSSDELLSRHTSLLEIAIISLYNRLVNSLRLDTEQFRSAGAIMALGDFGRGLLGPHQAIPLLFIAAESSEWLPEWLDEIRAPLEEAGWAVEISHGNIDRLVESAASDFGMMLNMLEMRYISGNRQLADQLEKSLDTLVETSQGEYLDRLHGSVLVRDKLVGETQTWLEPNLDSDPGGLAEIGAVRAGCRIAGNIRSLEDAIFSGYLVRDEVDLLTKAEKMYARLLSLLRTASGDVSGVLKFRTQEVLAKRLGYSARSGILPVEVFMQQVFQLLHGVACTSREFWERLQESRFCLEDRQEEPQRVLEDGIAIRCGKIYLHTERYPATPARMVHLFVISARQAIGFANVTRQWIRHNQNVLRTAAGDAAVKTELLEMLRLDSPDLPVTRRFYDYGLMTTLVPELASVHGLAQHDAFHLYPVHEHHIRTLAALKKLLSGEMKDSEPVLTAIASDNQDSAWLLLAGLLHDIGKSSGRGHAQHGREMIPSIAKRLALTKEETDLVQFLVAEHLLLMDNASLRDLADEQMLANCANAAGTSRRLDLLLLLSYADMAATGPRGSQKWRDTPVTALYDMIRHILEKGEPSPQAIAERVEEVRAQVAREVADLMDTQELESYLSRLVPRYLLSVAPPTIARHLRMRWELQHSGEPFIWEVCENEGMAELTLVSRQVPGLLSRAAGVMTLHDLNILGAQVFSMDEGMTLLSFNCRLPGPEESLEWEPVRLDMKKLLQGKMALDYRIAAHAASLKAAGPHHRGPASQVRIDNDSSPVYTILEVYTVDRVGLLYTISRTLFELQIRIYVAKVTTKVDQVADAFYIKTLQGEKVTDPERMDEIRNALLFWLDRPLPGL